MRETWEEALAKVQVLGPYIHLDIPVIGQAYLIFRARLLPPYTFACGPETLEVALFEPHEIPFDELAFSSMYITLRLFVQDNEAGVQRQHHGVINKRAGVKAWDLSACEYVDSFQVTAAAQ